MADDGGRGGAMELRYPTSDLSAVNVLLGLWGGAEVCVNVDGGEDWLELQFSSEACADAAPTSFLTLKDRRWRLRGGVGLLQIGKSWPWSDIELRQARFHLLGRRLVRLQRTQVKSWLMVCSDHAGFDIVDPPGVTDGVCLAWRHVCGLSFERWGNGETTVKRRLSATLEVDAF